MDKIALLLTGLAVIIGSIILMPNEVLLIADALYSIPPTPAWQTINVIEDPIIINSSLPSFSAINSFDEYYFGSDGTILINITEYSP